MKMTINEKKITKVVCIILILLVLTGCIGIIVKFTSGFTSNFKTFYLTIDNQDIMSEGNGYKLKIEESMLVAVNYTFDSSSTEKKSYSVKVVPNVVEGKDFDFTLDGNTYSFQAEKDLTGGFEIEKKDTSFTIKPKGGITEILKAVYPNNEINNCTDKSYEDMFSLVVTSYNGKEKTIINFSVIEEVRDIKLDKEEILF